MSETAIEKPKPNAGRIARAKLGTLVGTQPAEQPIWAQRDAKLRAGARDITTKCLDYMKLVEECVREKDWERFGYTDPEPYFDERIGIAWRTVYKYLAVTRAVGALPPGQQQGALETLAGLGISKAAALAPVLREKPEEAEDWLKKGAEMSRDALQEQVSVALGLQPRGLPDGVPGGRFLRYLLNQVPPEERETVQKVFVGLQRGSDVTDNDINAIAVLLHLVELGKQELVSYGRWKE